MIVTENGCSSLPSNILTVFISAVKDFDRNLLVHLYPNPVSNELYIETPGNSSFMQYEIHDAYGVLVLKGEVATKSIVDTKELVPGVYFIQIGKPGQTSIRKFVKE